MIKGIAHIALYTNKFKDTIRFYKDAFHAKELGIFQTDRRGAWLQIGTDILEIFESEELSEGSFKHIAIACECVDEAYQKALEVGAITHVEPKDICLELEKKRELRIAFVKGINGEQIELCEEK